MFTDVAVTSAAASEALAVKTFGRSQLISPLEGEMPGRAEGGERDSRRQTLIPHPFAFSALIESRTTP
ncbi:hypothetical protein J2Z17_001015 [Rhizobium halophytocola]|uniref:Propionyl-coenzyme A carboxylase alpha polypeptide n=1 Tax=Rhizobium halophytocola TaxID=735519 RepID=A0ABS4DV76_9HYPH|nr:hypothetical protein [Rhizobium halophytocola]